MGSEGLKTVFGMGTAIRVSKSVLKKEVAHIGLNVRDRSAPGLCVREKKENIEGRRSSVVVCSLSTECDGLAVLCAGWCTLYGV